MANLPSCSLPPVPSRLLCQVTTGWEEKLLEAVEESLARLGAASCSGTWMVGKWVLLFS